MVIVLLNNYVDYDNCHFNFWLLLRNESCYVVVAFVGIQSKCFFDSLEIILNSLEYSDQVRGTIF